MIQIDDHIYGEMMNTHVHKYVLSNGMTVLVRELHAIPKVSIQLFYGVGSRDEKLKEKGVAHLIEHMIFKGTDSPKGLSESDINMITHLLSGSCNAFTSYDYTGYLFNFPSHNWEESLGIMAECMQHCSFKPDMLNSEMKAVIQELKMYKDRYFSSLIEKLMSAIFSEHPYHYPIIGFKRDLWTVSSDDLKSFYKEHYKPNNATLIVVGDVDKDRVFALAQEKFGHIPADPSYKRPMFYHESDIASQSVTLYREIVQPLAVYMFVVPGLREKTGCALSVVERIIGHGRSSRLYKKLMNELKLVTSIDAHSYHLFDPGLFFITCEPSSIEDLPAIERVIAQELEDLIANGIQDDEFSRAYKKVRSSFYDLLEGIEDQANEIGVHYLATGDEEYLFRSLEQNADEVKKTAQIIINGSIRPAVMHKGLVAPLPEQEKKEWQRLQKESDEEDTRILSARARITQVEPPRQSEYVIVHKPVPFAFPKRTKGLLDTGLSVFSYHNDVIPKIHIVLQLKARSYYEPREQEGISNFVAHMLTEGTTNYTSDELADVLESRGMSLRSYPEGIAIGVLREDLEFALTILKELLTQATFDNDEIEKIRTQIIADIAQYWDDPRYFADQLIRNEIYKNHPYSKNLFGTAQTISAITQQDLRDFYNTYYSPKGASIAIVGDLDGYDVNALVQKYLGSWTGQEIESIEFPPLHPVASATKNHAINRDQITLCFAQLSVARKDPDFDALLVFNQIFGSGVLGSMNSRLFQLREQSGLFYSINGNFLVGSNEQPGIFLVKTLVSLDRLQEAKEAIVNTINTAVDTITDEEVEQAKLALINSLVDQFADNETIASTFLHMQRYGYPDDYYDTRAASLEKVSVDAIKKAVKRIIGNGELVTIQIGRM